MSQRADTTKAFFKAELLDILDVNSNRNKMPRRQNCKVVNLSDVDLSALQNAAGFRYRIKQTHDCHALMSIASKRESNPTSSDIRSRRFSAKETRASSTKIKQSSAVRIRPLDKGQPDTSA